MPEKKPDTPVPHQPPPVMEFANKLAQRKGEAGASLRQLTNLTASLRRPYSKSTIADKLTGRSKPDWEFVKAFVLACAAAERREPDWTQWRHDFERMLAELARWRRAHRTADGGLAGARARYLAGEPVQPSDVLEPEVLASWQRSGRTDHITTHYAGEPNLDTPLIKYGQPIVDHLINTWPGQPVSAILANPHAVICTRRTTDSSLEHHLDRHDLSPGFSYSEQHAATNGLGTALASHGSAYVSGPAHLADELQDDACAATVILDPLTNDSVGIIDLTCRHADAHKLLIAITALTAKNIADALQRDRLRS
jgi:hypothetical protein